jgi:hypothetical protein
MCPYTKSAPLSPLCVRASVANKQSSSAEVRGLGGQCAYVRADLLAVFIYDYTEVIYAQRLSSDLAGCFLVQDVGRFKVAIIRMFTYRSSPPLW